MRTFSRLLVLFVLLGFSTPGTAGAAYPTDFIHRKQELEGLSKSQRTQREEKRRAYHRRPTELQARLKQRRPKPEEKKISQRVRRGAVQKSVVRERGFIHRTKRVQERSVRRTDAHLQTLKETVLRAVNAERTAVGKDPLVFNAILGVSAQEYAEDMDTRGFFSHESPEGETPQKRMERAGYAAINQKNCNCRGFTAAFGENLARGQQTVEDAMNDWMHSPQHRANILSDRYTEIGVGIENEVWVQHFGSVKVEPR